MLFNRQNPEYGCSKFFRNSGPFVSYITVKMRARYFSYRVHNCNISLSWRQTQCVPPKQFCNSVIHYCNIKVKLFRYRPGVAQRVGRDIALLFHDRSTRRGWVVSSKPRPHFIPGKDPEPILQEVVWAPRSVWTGGKSRPHRDSIPDRPARSQSL